MVRNVIVALLVTLFSVGPLSAQSKNSWIQVETVNSEADAMQRISVYNAIFPHIGGFEMLDGQYAIAVGPFSELEGEFLMTQFLRTGLIPEDSFISIPDDFARQFYPPDAASLREEDSDTPPKKTQPDHEAEATLNTTEENQPELPQETLREARTSEARLSKDEKKELQTALKWAGFYNSTIDGLFGRGTRRSMSNWQVAKGYDDTGVLTTSQRAQLLRDYYAILSGLDVGPVTDEKAGITVDMPRAVVAFSDYTAPFAHYPSTDGSLAEVHLISRPGDRNTLYALFDVMQSLEIVPLEGRRKKNRNNFLLTGQNDTIISHTEAYLSGGQIKGFTLVWPASEAEQAQRLIERMGKSFTAHSAVLARGVGTELEPGQEELAGISVRSPSKIISGVFINSSGDVVTSSEIDATCEKIEVQGDMTYDLAGHAPELGLSAISPRRSVSPRGYGELTVADNRTGTRVSVAGYSFGGVLNAPTLTHGMIKATKGLQDEPHLNRLELEHFASDAGGAVLGEDGGITGILQPRDSNPDRQLPSDVSFMTESRSVQSFLKDSGIAYSVDLTPSRLAGVDLERHASDIAVWISCWE